MNGRSKDLSWPRLNRVKSEYQHNLVIVFSAFRDIAVINFAACFDKLSRLLAHSGRERLVIREALLLSVFADVLRDLHRAEMRAAHRAEMGEFGAFGRKRFVMIFAGDFRIESEIELVFPAKLKTSLR